MKTVETEVYYNADKRTVMEAYWRLENWPEVAAHVDEVQILYEADQIQHLTMTVSTKGKVADFKSVRAKMGDTIYYFQSNPPDFLHLHYGFWEMVEEGAGVTVKSKHFFEPIEDKARDFTASVQGLDKVVDINKHIGELLVSNSRQTMLALKNRIEAAYAVRD